jgi:hypothetical protein
MIARRLALLALLASAAGCVDNYASVRLFGLCFPPTPDDSGSCAYPASCDSLMLGALQFDVANPSPTGALIWPIQVDNQREPTVDASSGRTETAVAWVTGFELSYTSTVVSIPDVSVAAPEWHPVQPQGSSVVIVPLVPTQVATLLAGLPGGASADITVEVRAKGYYGDGTFFKTGGFKVQASAAAVAVGCPATAPTLAGVCPQAGQTGVPLCK